MRANIEKIYWLRVQQGLSIAELCKKSNVSKPTILRLFKGKTATRPDTIGKIAKALGITNVKELFLND